jgi:hypothetical protein
MRPARDYIHPRVEDTDGRSRHVFHRKVDYDAARRWERRLALARDHASWAIRLWATVLDEAIKDLCWKRAPHPSEGSRSALVQATVRWLTEADDTRTPGAFAWICRELELPAETVRDDVMADAKLGEALH